MFAIFTDKSLREFIEAGRVNGFKPPQADSLISDDLAATIVDGTIVFTHREDTEETPTIFVSLEAWEFFALSESEHRPGYSELMFRFFERVHRASKSFAQNDISIPRNWVKYSYRNLVAFFAVPKLPGWTAPYRWIAEKLPSGGACFWRVTGQGDEIRLEDFSPDYGLLEILQLIWRDTVRSTLDRLPPHEPAANYLQHTVDLSRETSQQVTQKRSYSSWLPLLSSSQRQVLIGTDSGALKVRGQAGSGKTLTLELRALREVYAAFDDGRTYRVLFLTHSWAMQEQVETSLSELDERGLWRQYIDVVPLPFLQESIQGSLPEGALLLGDDSLEGKKKQLDIIIDSVESVANSTGETYTNDVSQLIQLAIDDDNRGKYRTALAWQLMREFVEVIDANRLKPGVNSLKRYLQLTREEWMVPLSKEADRQFSFAVYRLYVARLVEEGQITTDQAVDDFRAYLEGYAWNLRRSTEGYDLIIVDEFHLFNDTERYLLHLLTTDPEIYPKLILAVDPAQSPFTLLTGINSSDLSRLGTERFGSGQAESIELAIIHRFTAKIHRFVSHIYDSLPNLIELGSDWTYSLPTSSGSSDANDGAVPKLYFYGEEEIIPRSVELALKANSQLAGQGRVALIGLTSADLAKLRDSVCANEGVKKNFSY
ncbi:UvrD-helicase domain-containing protein [Amycolatopsis sp. NPDC051716]|uniref:UvrD-helicase domain-containing protein n=1 Tax=Amycolatopsis sp. NPDC051716 TaxID=3155804 RepID=UPI00342824F1